MTVWRIGSNWGDVNVLTIFKKYQIAFAGQEVRNYLQAVKPNDLIAVTDGQKIVAIGKATEVVNLKDIDTNLENKFENILALKIHPYYFSDDVKIDFGIYGGQGKQFHKAHGEYDKLIVNNFNKIINQQMIEDKIEILKYKHQIILQGPPGTGKTRLAKLLADELIKPISKGKSIDLVNDFFKSFLNYCTVKSYNMKKEYEGCIHLVDEKRCKANRHTLVDKDIA